MHFLPMLTQIVDRLGWLIDEYGNWIYFILFLIIFCETGLIIFPFLPGDSLLFVAGAFAAQDTLSLPFLIFILLLAATLGNTLNYGIGRYIGPKVFDKNWRWLDRQALLKTQRFYLLHGGKTVILARFVPIIRTFAPFVAGISAMQTWRFQFFNMMGALLWGAGLPIAGYYLGNIPIIKKHLNAIVIIGVSAAIVPLVLGSVWKIISKRINRKKVFDK